MLLAPLLQLAGRGRRPAAAACRWACSFSRPAAESAASGSAEPQRQPATPGSAAEPATSFITTSPEVAQAAAAKAGMPSGSVAASLAATAGGLLAGSAAAPLREYTMRQVAKHATDESCWIVVNGKVYDCTAYLDDHPGGSESILLNAGVDCTEEFMGVHSEEAKQLLEKFVIGTVKGKTKERQPATVTSTAAQPAAADAGPPEVLLRSPTERYTLPLAAKRQLSPDTFWLRFSLPGPQTRLGLPCGKHVFMYADINGETVVRAYTPLSGDRDLGVLDLLLKVYWAGMHPRFPEGGKMSQHLARLKEGDTIDVKGPFGKFEWRGNGHYTLNRARGRARYLSMVAGGSGITPCWAVAREALRDPHDTTRIAVVYANKHAEDIWLRQELDELAAAHPERFHVWYVLEEPPANATPGAALPLAAPAGAAAVPWKFSSGFITPDMLAQHLLPPHPVVLPEALRAKLPGAAAAGAAGDGDAAGSLALMCGPPGMLEHVVVPSLTALGFMPEQMVVF